MSLKIYDSLPTFLVSSGERVSTRSHMGGGGHRWDLGVNGVESHRRAHEGDLSLVNQAMALVDKITPVIGEAHVSQWVAAPAGERVDVPAFLAGAPMAMKTRKRSQGQGRRVTVCVDLTSSCGIDALDLVTRGCAVIALIESLQRARVQVDLSIACGCSSTTEHDREIWGIVPIESRPLDLSQVSFILAHPSFPRNVFYRELERWGFDGMYTHMRHDYEKIRKYLGLSGDDVFVPCAYYHDDLIWKDPERWVQERLTQCLNPKSPSLDQPSNSY